MALVSFSKLSIFVSLAILSPQLVDTVAFMPENAIKIREAFQPNIYGGYPQEYYTPQTYHKYTPQPKNEIQAAVVPTETLPSSDHKTSVIPAKYLVTQVTNPPQATHGSQTSNPYSYAIARVVPSSITYSKHGSESKYEEIPKKFHYGYRVSNPYTGTEFGHSEVNDGQIAKGYYHVLLPDGRLQNVRYWAGPSGYHATITYETKY